MASSSARGGGRGGAGRFDPPMEFGLLGLVSGGLTVILFTVVALPKTEWAIPGTDWAISSDPFSVIPGLVFGIVIGAGLLWRGRAGIGQAAAYVVASAVSNFAATNLAYNIFESLDSGLTTGMIAGLFGATCLAALTLLILPFSRRWRPCVLMLAAGGLLGGLLAVPLDYLEEETILVWLVLYGPWQAGFAAAFATAMGWRK